MTLEELAERCEEIATMKAQSIWNEYGTPSFSEPLLSTTRREAAELFTIAAGLRARAASQREEQIIHQPETWDGETY